MSITTTRHPLRELDRAKGLYRLGEAAEMAGLTVAQLQYYVMVGVVSPSGRSGGKQRLFDEASIRRMRIVRLLNQWGYPLREIREVFVGDRAPD